MPIIPRYQPQGGPSVGGLNYAGAYSPPDGSDWRMLGQVAQATGAVFDTFAQQRKSQQPEHEQPENKSNPRERQNPHGGSDDKPGRRVAVGGAVSKAAADIAQAMVAAGSSLADATALTKLSERAGALDLEVSGPVIGDAYAPAIAAATTPEERVTLESNRNSLTEFWALHGAKLRAEYAATDREALADRTLQVGLEAIKHAPTYETVEGIGERQLWFSDIVTRGMDGDPATLQARRLDRARSLREAAERRKAALNPRLYLAATGSEGLSTVLGQTQFQLSDEQIRGEAEAIGRGDILNLSPEDFAISARQDGIPAKAQQSRYDRALQHFGGDQALAVAALLAGPEVVDGWLATIGDPRSGAISYADFRKAIPDVDVRDRLNAIDTALFGSVSGLLTPQIRADVRREAQERVDIEDQDHDRQLNADADGGSVNVAGIRQAIAEGRLDPKRPAVQRAIASASRREAREAQRRDDAALMARVRRDENFELDLDNPAHRRALDRDYAAVRARNPNVPFKDLVFAYVKATGQLPTAANDQLNRMLLSSDPEDLAVATEVYTRFEAADPAYLNGLSPKARTRGGYLRDRWNETEDKAYAAQLLRERDNMGEGEVAQRNGWFEKALREDPRLADRILRQELFADREVQSYKSLPGTARQLNPIGGARFGAFLVPPAMVDDLNNVARARYRDHLDPARAYREAYDDVRHRWQPSYINGAPEFMRMPPDRIYAIDGEKPEITARWQRIQAGWRFRIPESSHIRFREPPSLTNRGKVVYEIWYADDKGHETRVFDWQTGRPAVWTPDVAGENAHRKRERLKMEQATRDYEDKKAQHARDRAFHRRRP